MGMGERTTFFLPWKTGQSHLFAVQPVGSEEGQVFSRDLVVDAFCSFVHLLFARFFQCFLHVPFLCLFFCTKLSRKQVDVEAATEKKIQEKKAASKVGWV